MQRKKSYRILTFQFKIRIKLLIISAVIVDSTTVLDSTDVSVIQH